MSVLITQEAVGIRRAINWLRAAGICGAFWLGYLVALPATYMEVKALGEHLFSKHDFTHYIVQGAVDVLQPDVCLIGGFTEAMRVGVMADAHGLAVAPHFMTNLHIHLATALPGAVYVEYYPVRDDLLEHGGESAGGKILVPDRPGHDVSFTPEAWQRYRVC